MLRAISGDAVFLELLRNGEFSGSVHSVFRNAINLHNQADGNLYALAAERFGNIPDTLLIADGAFALIDAEAGAPAHTGSDALLFVGGTALSFAQCREWSGHLAICTANRAHLLANAALLDALIAEKGQPGGLKATDDASVFARETARALMESSSALVAALAGENIDAALGPATGLIGLGPGLTPSGDDFLAGLMATLHCSPSAARRDGYRILAATIAGRAQERTNIISATALKNAAAGRVPESVVTLLAALDHGEEQLLAEAAARVLAIGSSSGTDMLYGIGAGLRLVAADARP